MNLSFISWIDKELGESGIHRKQEYDFYISSSREDQCIMYLQDNMHVNNQIQPSKQVALDVHTNPQINAQKSN